MSDVFHSMFENPNNEECQKSAVNLEGIDPSTIKAFKRILLSLSLHHENHVEKLLLFATTIQVHLLY